MLGTPGSGKSYAVVNNFIKQNRLKRALVNTSTISEYPDLSTIAYNHLLNHPDGYKVKPKFYVINSTTRDALIGAIPFTRILWKILRMPSESAYTIMLNPQ